MRSGRSSDSAVARARAAAIRAGRAEVGLASKRAGSRPWPRRRSRSGGARDVAYGVPGEGAPRGTVILLDSGRIDVMALAGRSFHYKPLGATGDREGGQVIGEYTLELRNENAHGVITGLTG